MGKKKKNREEKQPEKLIPEIPKEQRANKTYEQMSVEELQAEILERMAKNGPITEQMKRDVVNNIWHDSLVSWVKSFR